MVISLMSSTSIYVDLQKCRLDYLIYYYHTVLRGISNASSLMRMVGHLLGIKTIGVDAIGGEI